MDDPDQLNLSEDAIVKEGGEEDLADDITK
jgi:hypothetical protein